MSARMSARAASVACSGAMNAGVPIIAPSPVRSAPCAPTPATLASPKSSTFTAGRPLTLVRIRLPGLMSRWTMPASCACCNPMAAAWA